MKRWTKLSFALRAEKRRTSPSPKVGRGTYSPPTCSAHANGGAAEVKKALFFGGSTPFLWASTKEMGSKGRTGQRPPPNVSAHTHNPKEQIKRGTPGEGSPLDPLLRFNKHKRVPPAAERGQGLCPWTLPPLKRRAKLSCARCASNFYPSAAALDKKQGRPYTPY